MLSGIQRGTKKQKPSPTGTSSCKPTANAATIAANTITIPSPDGTDQSHSANHLNNSLVAEQLRQSLLLGLPSPSIEQPHHKDNHSRDRSQSHHHRERPLQHDQPTQYPTVRRKQPHVKNSEGVAVDAAAAAATVLTAEQRMAADLAQMVRAEKEESILWKTKSLSSRSRTTERRDTGAKTNRSSAGKRHRSHLSEGDSDYEAEQDHASRFWD